MWYLLQGDITFRALFRVFREAAREEREKREAALLKQELEAKLTADQSSMKRTRSQTVAARNEGARGAAGQ
jgi:hypothetical protein